MMTSFVFQHRTIRLVGLVYLSAASLIAPAVAGESYLKISGIYPHLAVYNQPEDVADRPQHGECGLGAIVPWADRLWYLTYPQHKTTGSNDKLYELDADMDVTIRPESVGGTHASRMIHRESNQLVIGPYFIDAERNVRAADLNELRGRMTAVMRHLEDPADLVYFFDMEGAIYEVDVHTLAVKRLFKKPVPGWHGKGGYTAQGRVVIANNGERGGSSGLGDLLAGGPPVGEEAGVLAEWDGSAWRIVERKQFLDVTGPGGIYGSPTQESPLWAIGWDKRSVILKLLDGGRWYTFRTPKSSLTFDPRHGWYTEWPRIREIAPDRPMMCVHGGMFDFPKTFSAKNTAGIRPMCTHLRYIPDFCYWNDKVILGADDSSMMDNPMCGQAQSNLWFGTIDDLTHFGPKAGWGGPWLGDTVTAGEPSDPFLIAGYQERVVHLALGVPAARTAVARCSDRFTIQELPGELAGAVRVAIARGDYHDPTPGYGFTVDRDVVVYLAVDARGEAELDDSWQQTRMGLTWDGYPDAVYVKRFAAGRVEIPGHSIPHHSGAYAVPNLCFLLPTSGEAGEIGISDLPEDLGAQVSRPPVASDKPAAEVTLTLQIDRRGDGTWSDYESIRMPKSGYAFRLLPQDLDAEWLRVVADKDCCATAHFHGWSSRPKVPGEASLFDAVADADTPGEYVGGLIRPAAHNRSLQWIVTSVGKDGGVSPGEYCEVTLDGTDALAFTRPDENREEEVRKVAEIKHDFEVDAASVIVTAYDGLRYRLPKGSAAFDQPFADGWPRGVRECVSERFLANLHGTFYELPRGRDNRSPDFDKIKPVASHNKRISDFCTWRGLFVISGTRPGAKADGQFFAGANGRGLWFGTIDDLWKLGKPVGHGGPWLETPVESGRASDPYLMTGYDRKQVELRHDQNAPVTFTIEVDFDHAGFHQYGRFTVPEGETFTHVFPEGFQAHWIRFKCDTSCRATAMLRYE